MKEQPVHNSMALYYLTATPTPPPGLTLSARARVWAPTKT